MTQQLNLTTPSSSSSNNNQLTILDDSSPGPFEGPEKLLELWFAPSAEHVEKLNLSSKGKRKVSEYGDSWQGLRAVEQDVWDDMLDEVQCKVLSVIEGDGVDAYLLSESSMFVWPHKLILKTCGTTTLLLGLPTLLRIASELCDLKGVWRCFYSRKTFMFPDRQRGPHKDWSMEMSFLDKLFENASAYTVGRMNGDHWLLYLTPPQDDVLQPSALTTSSKMAPSVPSTPLSELSDFLSSHSVSTSPRIHRPLPVPGPSSPARVVADQTLEILMTRLAPSVCQSFYHPSSTPDNKSSYISPLLASSPSASSAHALGGELSKKLDITDLLPNATMDSFLFEPCGYSMNAVQEDRYATIHVTPEEAWSYASFECNFDFKGNELQALVEKVLRIFMPQRLSITLFVSDDEEEEMKRELLNDSLAGMYERKDRILYDFDGYRLVYAVFEGKK